jgi:hypothetical protein
MPEREHMGLSLLSLSGEDRSLVESSREAQRRRQLDGSDAPMALEIDQNGSFEKRASSAMV